MNATQGSIPEPRETRDFSDILSHASPYLDAIHHYLSKQVQQFEPEIREAVTYCLSKGGKRIRPVLVYFSGYREGLPSPELVKVGAIIELVHMATLVHDDIIDGASMRHGRNSVPEQYGSTVAVLLGDALFSHALVLAAEYPTSEVCREVATSTRTVCTGEIHQTFQRGNARIGIKDYYRCIEMKTAELFRVACFLGARIGGYPDAFCNASASFGNALGTAYQIFDDYADLFSTEQKMGKTLQTDLGKGKFTLPLLLLLEVLSPSEGEILLQKLNQTGTPHVESIETLMEQHGIKSMVMAHFEQQLALAATALEPFRHQPAGSRLQLLLDFVSAQMRLLT